MKYIWIVIFIYTIYLSYYTYTQSNDLVVSFLDVGQGDSILIETKEGINILIDTGPNEVVVRKISEVLNYFEKNIDLVILTHADLDHIGGMVSVIDRYEIESLGYAFDFDESQLTKYMYEKVEEDRIDLLRLKAGDQFNIGELYIDILWPLDTYVGEKNDMSVVTLIKYFDNSILLTGDASVEIEEKLISMYEDLDVDILKLGHHGSKTSTSEEFLLHTKPEVVVVSAGEGNNFGHPHKEVIDRVLDMGIQMKTTIREMVVFEL